MDVGDGLLDDVVDTEEEVERLEVEELDDEVDVM